MVEGSHDTLVYRLAQILIRLNQGEKLDPQALAEEFGVNLRTIQRDLNVRMAYLPLQKSRGRYSIDPAYLGNFTPKDIERFSALAGVSGLFPSLSSDFLREVFDSRMQSVLMIRGHDYETLVGKEGQFRELQRAIAGRNRVDFSYAKAGRAARRTGVECFKLLNDKGVWYVAAKDKGKLKTFSFSRIGQLEVRGDRFAADPDAQSRFIASEGVWTSSKPFEAVIEVDAPVAKYFKRRKLIANQVLKEERPDGSLVLSAMVGHSNQILPIVRYWIPHLRIKSPGSLQKRLEKELSGYLS